jgi:protein-tyrosine phosphatase
MVKILMVCLGNICRSPLAEGILRSKVNGKNVIVDSAGTGGWHVGQLPDERSIQIANVHQIDITDQRCRKFKVEDFDKFDKIYVMDETNYRDVMAYTRNADDERKVEMILNRTFPGGNMDVPDPYYGGSNGFQQVYDMLDEACEAIVKDL